MSRLQNHKSAKNSIIELFLVDENKVSGTRVNDDKDEQEHYLDQIVFLQMAAKRNRPVSKMN